MSVRAPVGDVNIVNRMIAIGRGLVGIKSSKISTAFLFIYLSTLKSSLESKASGTTFKSINSEIVKRILVPIPPFQEQNRIVEKILEALQD